MYDLVNIFLVLGIIKKKKDINSKPGYSWQGLEGLNSALKNINLKEKKY